jgi:ribosomal protein L40E
MSKEVVPIEGKPCRRCGTLLALDATACSGCGALTDNATFKERAEFEVAQWRAYKARANAESA